MDFSKRLMILSAVPVGALVLAALSSVLALNAAEQRFADVFEQEQPLALAVTEMVGHGLQSGQALRSILLDPTNAIAYKHLARALTAYDETAAVAATLAVGTPVQPLLARVGEARTRQRAARERILRLAGNDSAAALALLNQEDTPAWREMRSGLIEAGKLARAGLQAKRQQILAETRRDVSVGMAMALLGTVLAAASALLARRTLASTLAARSPAVAVAEVRTPAPRLSQVAI